MAEEEPYTVVEIEDMLGELANSRATITKILRVYELWGCEERAGMTAHDIMSKLWTDTLDGIRSWKRGITVEQHFKENGRSIISNLEKKLGSEIDVDILEQDAEVAKMDLLPVQRSSHPPAEAKIEQQQTNNILSDWSKKVLDLFSGDTEALCYLKQFLNDNVQKTSIMSVCKLTETAYNNARKRIKDKVRKRFPNGIKWWELEQ